MKAIWNALRKMFRPKPPADQPHHELIVNVTARIWREKTQTWEAGPVVTGISIDR